MILIIDNYDSFTYNVVQAVSSLTNENLCVVRNDECEILDLQKMNPSRLIISPGPGKPLDAGISEEAVKFFAGKIPILGICLGHQAICEAFGAKIVPAKFIKHGIAEKIDLDGRGLFRTLGKYSIFTRYHSLAVDEKTLPPNFEITARANDGEVMGIRHKTLAIEGVQFHPESVASNDGKKIFESFLNYRRENLNAPTILSSLLKKTDLTESQAELFMENLTDGTLDERQAAGILVAIEAKGVSSSELAGCARVLCKKKKKFPISGENLAEIVGTGGDGKGSFNISSLSAVVAASCGQKVAKHGNRAISSKSGAADFFESLGVKIDGNAEQSAKLLQKTGFAFLFAPIYHEVMKFVAPVRNSLGIKTIMNCIGPLSNPADARYQVLGVYSACLLAPFARAAKALGAKRVMTIASEDGYDEISPCAITHVFQINEDGKEFRYKIDPKKFEINSVNPAELLGGTGAQNATLAFDILSGGGRKTIKEAVSLNAGALLYLCGKAKTIKGGYDLAKSSIENGNAKKKLEQIASISSEL